MENIFDQIKPLLRYIPKASRYIGGEFRSPKIKADAQQFNFCMCYPDIYDIGQSNQAVRILCNRINDEEGFAAQRSYLPDAEALEIFRANNIKMFSLESFSPLNQFDAIGITVSHDLIATNICELLDFAGIPIKSKDRNEEHPFVFGGGPIYCNPEPYHAFFDAIFIGEGEELDLHTLKQLKSLKEVGLSRQEILQELAKLDSVYVPSMYKEINQHQLAPKYKDVPPVIKKTVYESFSNSSAFENCIVPYTEVVHNRLTVEIMRGCARSCRFCQAGMMYRPVRERSCENICDSVIKGLKDTGYDEVSLTSLSSTDHSQIKKILEALNNKLAGKGVRISIPSQRMDAFGLDMAKLVSGQKKGGLTFAIEAGTQRLRDVINKNVNEEDIFSSVKYAFENGWNRCKLYFMIGLPTETDEDLLGIADLCERILLCAKDSIEERRKHSVTVSVSCAIFVPKAQTPFMWGGQISYDEAQRRINLIRSNLHSKAISFGWHDPKSSFIEAALSRGGRECCELIERAWRNGACFDAWKEHFSFQAWQDAAKECGLSLEDLAAYSFDYNAFLPWDHIDLGIDKHYLIEEHKKAKNAITTPDCTFGNCSNCGICKNYKTHNFIQEKRG